MNNDRLEIKKMWRIFAAGPDSVLELRALWPKGVPDKKPAKVLHFRSKDFQSVDLCKQAFEDAGGCAEFCVNGL